MVISGLQRAWVLAALQVFPDSWKHVFTPHRHQVGSGCSLSPILWRPAEVNREQATSQPPSPLAHSPRTSGLCAVSLPDAWKPQPARGCVHMCAVQVLKPEEARTSGRATPSSLLCPHFPQVGGCVGDPGFRTQQQTGGQQGLACSVAPSFTPPLESTCVMVGGGCGGEAALCSEWLLGEHTVPPRTLKE